MIHIVFSAWEQGFETSPTECPPVECGQSDGATGALYRKDKVSQSRPDTGHVVTERWGPTSGQWRAVKAAVGLLTGHMRSDTG